MPQSALLGDPPKSHRDILIRIGMKASAGSIFNPNKLNPYGPPRPSPDLADESDAYKVMATEIACLVLTLGATAGRFWLRAKLEPAWSFGLDDLMVIPAFLCGVGYFSSIAAFTGPCYGRHMWVCTYEQIEAIFMTFQSGQVVFYFGVYCAKISLVFFYRRITTSTSAVWRYVHWTLLAIVISCGLSSLFGTAFSCIPAPSHYSFEALARTNPGKLHCIDSTNYQFGLRGLHIGTDIILLCFPLTVLYRLQMPTKKKIAIGWIFCFGIMCCICSIMRNVTYQRPSEDFTYDSHSLVIWDTLDFAFAIMVPSLPMFYRPFDNASKRIRQIVRSTISQSHTRSDRNNSRPSKRIFSKRPVDSAHTQCTGSNSRNDEARQVQWGNDILLSDVSRMGRITDTSLDGDQNGALKDDSELAQLGSGDRTSRYAQRFV